MAVKGQKGRKLPPTEKQKKKSATYEFNRMVKGEVYNELRKALTDPNNRNKKAFFETFIQAMIKGSLKDVNSPVGILMAKQFLQDDILSSLDNQTEKLLSRDVDFILYRIQKSMFKQQRDVFLDSMVRRKCIMCSRRAGKSILDSRLLIGCCVRPNSPCLYVNLTFTNAINQAFDECVAVAEEIELAIDSQSKSDGVIKFANGSMIVFRGNNNKAAADKCRGYKFRLAIIDEAGHQVNMPYLLNEVIEPLLLDFNDSILVLTGTPPRVKNTYFEHAWFSKEWTKYHWTMLDNPFIHNAEEEIERICREKGLTIEDSFIKREYKGEISYDTEAMVFKDYKVYESIPDDFQPSHIAIGCDWGFADYNSIITLAYDVDSKRAFVIEEKKFNKATMTYIISEVQASCNTAKKFFTERNSFADLNNFGIYCDTNEDSLVFDLATTYNLPAYKCYKYDKAPAIAQLSDMCRTGKVQIPKDGILADEFEQTIYKRDEQDNILPIIDESFHPDAADALLYASRQMFFDMGEDYGGQGKEFY